MSNPEDPDAIISRTEGEAGPVEVYNCAVIGLDILYEEAAAGNAAALSALAEIADEATLALNALRRGAEK